MVTGATGPRPIATSTADTPPNPGRHGNDRFEAVGVIFPSGRGRLSFPVVDPNDGKAYHYFERVHKELICADLTEDYTDVSGFYSTHFPGVPRRWSAKPLPTSTGEGCTTW